MGNTSKELKEIKQKAEKPYPVVGKDYYLVYVKSSKDRAPANWIAKHPRKSAYTRAKIIELLAAGKDEKPNINIFSMFGPLWYLVPGPRPSPKWGPEMP